MNCLCKVASVVLAVILAFVVGVLAHKNCPVVQKYVGSNCVSCKVCKCDCGCSKGQDCDCLQCPCKCGCGATGECKCHMAGDADCGCCETKKKPICDDPVPEHLKKKKKLTSGK